MNIFKELVSAVILVKAGRGHNQKGVSCRKTGVSCRIFATEDTEARKNTDKKNAVPSGPLSPLWQIYLLVNLPTTGYCNEPINADIW